MTWHNRNVENIPHKPIIVMQGEEVSYAGPFDDEEHALAWGRIHCTAYEEGDWYLDWMQSP